jgi:hypothetical protein
MSTQRAFGLTNNSSRPINVSNKEPTQSLQIFMDRGELKIGTRQAKRWPLVKLVDLALRLGSSEMKTGIRKDEVIAIIERLARKKGLFGQNTMRIEGSRNIRHFTKDKLIRRVMKVYGVRLNERNNMETLVSKTKKIQLRRMKNRVFNEMFPGGPNVNQSIRNHFKKVSIEENGLLTEQNFRAHLRNRKSNLNEIMRRT